jgi:hypothetical protein
MAISTPLAHANTRKEQSGVAKPRRTLLSDIRIDYGPSDLLGRFFLASIASASKLGISFSFGTFEDLILANLENRDSWRPLNPTFNPTSGLVAPETSCVILGRNTDGKVVTSLAIKVFEWANTNFKLEAESLRILYADPAAMAPYGAKCEVNIPSADKLTGRVAYSGAGWLHPSVRGNQIGAIMSRIIRIYAYTRWNVDVSCALSASSLMAKGYTKQNGFVHEEQGVKFFGPDLGPPDAGVAWATADEMIDDLSVFLDQMMSSGADQMRHAQ